MFLMQSLGKMKSFVTNEISPEVGCVRLCHMLACLPNPFLPLIHGQSRNKVEGIPGVLNPCRTQGSFWIL